MEQTLEATPPLPEPTGFVTVLPQASVHDALVARLNDDSFQDRHLYIGGSEIGDCARIIAYKKLHPEATRITDPEAAGRILAGKILENAIVQLVRQSLAGKVRETGRAQLELVHPTAPLRCHPDGRITWDLALEPGHAIVYLDEKAQRQVRREPLVGMGSLEIKTAGSGVYRSMLKKGLPTRYVDQATIEMGLSGTQWCLLVLASRENAAQFVTFLLFFDAERFEKLGLRATFIMDRVDRIAEAVQAGGEDPIFVEEKLLPDPEIERGYCSYCPLRESCPAYAAAQVALDAANTFPEDVAVEVAVLAEEFLEIKPPFDILSKRVESVKDRLKEYFLDHGVTTAFGLQLTESQGRLGPDLETFQAKEPDAFAKYQQFTKRGAPSHQLKILRQTGGKSAAKASSKEA